MTTTTNHPRPQSFHYIGIGAQDHFFTLRYAQPEPRYYNDPQGLNHRFLGYEFKHYHVRNLSQNAAEAEAKAKDITGQDLKAPTQDDLAEIRRRSAEEIERAREIEAARRAEEEAAEQYRLDAFVADWVNEVFYNEFSQEQWEAALQAAGEDVDAIVAANHRRDDSREFDEVRAMVEPWGFTAATILDETYAPVTDAEGIALDIFRGCARWGGQPSRKQADFLYTLEQRHATEILTATLPSLDEFFGTVGLRETVDVTVAGMYGFEGHYGWTTIVTLVTTDGRTLKWFASNVPQEFEIGWTGTVKATVKGHDTYKGARETKVNRVAIA